MNAPTPALGLTRFEMIVHGLADGIGGYELVSCLKSWLWDQEDLEPLLIPASLSFLVILLSVAVIARRLRPERRGLRILDLGLSGLMTLLGVIGAVATLAIMISGANYKGPSPDAGGMAVVAGLVVYYPCAAFIVLPFAMNNRRLPDGISRRVGWLTGALALLPICVLLAIRLL